MVLDVTVRTKSGREGRHRVLTSLTRTAGEFCAEVLEATGYDGVEPSDFRVCEVLGRLRT